jgi:uncharacterized membrane protein YedE/YeeE
MNHEPMNPMRLLPYVALGGAFGFLLVEAEVVSWFRIQEMFRFEAFHMYGIIGAAVVTAAMSLLVIKRLGLRSPDGQPLALEPKTVGSGVRYLAGGSMFGLGWALTGACPGPLVALVGAGVPVMLVTILSALVGTWTYGRLRPRLPH